jgi:DNA-binding response OmpR family regulator
MYKILIIEDDLKIRDIVASELMKWGFLVHAVERFDAVLDEFQQAQPHLVLMDVNLPSRDGFDWCGRIRKVSKAPVLYLSARDSSMDIVMAVSQGGDDYITKPFSMDVLVAKVNALLRRAYSYHEGEQDTLERNGALLNLSGGTIAYDGNSAELTRNEMKILGLLMKAGGAIVSRDRLMRELWQDESFIDDNTLTVNVNRLRKKLQDVGLVDFIRTAKNQGYQVK